MGTAPSDNPPLWQCPECGERFTTRNQWHSCGSFKLDDLFAHSDPTVRPLYDEFLEIVVACGEVTVIPQKTRIALQVRMRFAALMPRKTSLRGHLVLSRRCPSLCFEKVETFSRRNHLHAFRLESVDDLDDEFRYWVREAYKVGCQKHLDEQSG